MRPTSPLHRHARSSPTRTLAAAVALAVVALFAACTRTVEPPPAVVLIAPAPSESASAEPVAPAPSESASATPPPDPPAADPTRKAAWTDADYVAQLANECSWKPLWHYRDKANPLLCMATAPTGYDTEYCHQENEDHCKPACVKTCAACDDTCVQGCYACKGRCTDDACRLACATKCGQCRQACSTAQERCQVGGCNHQHEVCLNGIVAEWKKSPCSKSCDTLLTCVNTCAAKPNPKQTPGFGEGTMSARSRCLDGCWPALMGGCSRKKFSGFCPNLLF